MLPGREGFELNHKKLFRLYREERLTVRRRGGRKRALGTRVPMTIPQERWSRIGGASCSRPGSMHQACALRVIIRLLRPPFLSAAACEITSVPC
jgi:hypothetical protein